MNGPSHYREAERLLDAASNMGVPREVETYRLRAAQVHATLALVAATVEPGEFPGWREAVS
jgi:hypothetical protein